MGKYVHIALACLFLGGIAFSESIELPSEKGLAGWVQTIAGISSTWERIMEKIILSFMLLGFASPSFAKAYYAPKKEMIQKAGSIVIVEVTKVEKSEKRGKAWTYSQKASATVKQCLKGDAKGEIEIYGMEGFICAQCHYEKGTFILFLRQEEGFWVGSNWHLGIRPITKGNVQWFKDDETRFEMKLTPLDDVIKEINAVVTEQKKETPNKPDTGDGK